MQASLPHLSINMQTEHASPVTLVRFLVNVCLVLFGLAGLLDHVKVIIIFIFSLIFLYCMLKQQLQQQQKKKKKKGIHCQAKTEENAQWPTSASNTEVVGVCQQGYRGSPSRTCLIDGTFGPILNPCLGISFFLFFFLFSIFSSIFFFLFSIFLFHRFRFT